MDLKLVYDNYMRDIQIKERHNMSYSEYMEIVIDKLINQQHQDCPNQQDNLNTVMNSASSVVLLPASVTPSTLASHLNDLIVISKQDIHNPSKICFFSP